MQTMETKTSTDDRHLSSCIENCLWCHEAATRCIFHCLSRGGVHADPAHIRMLMDCADIAQTSADFMVRGSDYHHFTCGVCSKICEHCAEACDALDPDDDHMAHCAEACRRCAESCHEMAAHHAVQKSEQAHH